MKKLPADSFLKHLEKELEPEKLMITRGAVMSIGSSIIGDRIAGNQQPVATLNLLCEVVDLKDEELKIIMLTVYYLLKDEYEQIYLETLPFYERRKVLGESYVGEMLSNAFVGEAVPRYFTDLTIDYCPNDSDLIFRCEGANNAGTKTTFEFDTRIFASLSRIDSAITNYCGSIEDINLSLVHFAEKAGERDNKTEIIFAESIGSVLALADINKAGLCAEYFVRYKDAEGNEKVIGCVSTIEKEDEWMKWRKKKYKGNTLNKLMERAREDKKTYFEYFNFRAYVESLKSEYVFVKFHNNDNSTILLALSPAVQEELRSKIYDF